MKGTTMASNLTFEQAKSNYNALLESHHNSYQLIKTETDSDSGKITAVANKCIACARPTVSPPQRICFGCFSDYTPVALQKLKEVVDAYIKSHNQAVDAQLPHELIKKPQDNENLYTHEEKLQQLEKENEQLKTQLMAIENQIESRVKQAIRERDIKWRNLRTRDRSAPTKSQSEPPLASNPEYIEKRRRCTSAPDQNKTNGLDHPPTFLQRIR